MARFEDGCYGTAAGIALIAKVLAGRCKMEYTRVSVGKGTIPEDLTPKTMTEPADYVMDAKIASITNPVDGECQVTVQINSADVEHGFYATGLVLHANDPDDGEIAFTYLCLENDPEWVRPSSSIVGKLATFDIIAAVGDVDTVSAAIDPEAIATVARVAQMIADHNEDPDAHSSIISAAVATAIQKAIATGTYYGVLPLTIPAEDWVAAEDPSADHNFVCDVVAEGVTRDLIPNGAPIVGSFGVANKAGVVPGCETFDGYVRFYSKSVPTQDINACIILLKQGGESGGDAITQDMLGDGLTVTDSGKLSVAVGNGLTIDNEGALAVDTADDETASGAIEDVFAGQE